MNSPRAPTDFDFFPGNWQVSHRRLKQRLAGSNDWKEFGGTCSVQTLLGGLGNVDDNVIALPGAPYRAVTLRSYNAATQQWTIWWLDGRVPGRLDAPMVGAFNDGVGTFYGDDTLDGRAIKLRFLWTLSAVLHAIWNIKPRLSCHGCVANPRDTSVSLWFAPCPDPKSIIFICPIKHATLH